MLVFPAAPDLLERQNNTHLHKERAEAAYFLLVRSCDHRDSFLVVSLLGDISLRMDKLFRFRPSAGGEYSEYVFLQLKRRILGAFSMYFCDEAFRCNPATLEMHTY